ncbi:hypothetical protein LINPERHAP1_LOCUS19182, partial [Linum perenne]
LLFTATCFHLHHPSSSSSIIIFIIISHHNHQHQHHNHHHLIRMSMLHVVSELEVLLMIKPSFPRFVNMPDDWCKVMIAQIYLEGEPQELHLKFKKEVDNKITWEELKVGMRAKFKVDFSRFV